MKIILCEKRIRMGLLSERGVDSCRKAIKKRKSRIDDYNADKIRNFKLKYGGILWQYIR